MNQAANNISVKDSPIEALIGQVADDFAARLARGERATIEEYTAKYPEHAKIIEQVLRSVAVMQTFDLDSELGSDLSTVKRAAHRQLGDFHIVREIGRGGMGTVYEAQQLSMDRRVALKVLPFAALLDDRQLLRFKNEARTAGTLHHPHIVPVYSVGVERGVHFYAMQYIEGPSLAEVLIDLHADEADFARYNSSASTDLPPTTDSSEGTGASPVAASPESEANSIIDTRRELQAMLSTARSSSRREYFEMVARWGIQACQALAHAHESGVLHRDIKPGNLLIDERGELWITDFGLARLEQDASMTASGDIVGTLRYMAPEQALGKRVLIDHRADIYSLGATLYELLGLQPAFCGEDREALLHAVAFDEPTALRKHDASIPVDLETIVLKAMEKRPEDRYLTAEEMANDLQRFLENKPIQAKPASRWQRCAKWSRRHVAVVWSLVFVLLTVSVVMAVAIMVVMNERSKVLQEQATTERALQRAETSAQLAKDAVDDMYVNFAKEWLGTQMGLTDTQRSFLEKAAAFYAQMPVDLEASPAAQVSAATTSRHLCRIYRELGKIDEANDAIHQAIAMLEALHAKPSTSGNIESRRVLAECYLELDRFEGPPQPNVVDSVHKAAQESERLFAEHPDDYEVRSTRAVAKARLGRHHHRLLEYDEADQLYSEAHTELQQIVDASPDNFEFLDELCTIVSQRASSNLIVDKGGYVRGMRPGRRDEARELCLLSIELAQRLSEKAPGNLRYQFNVAKGGVTACGLLEAEEAIQHLQTSEEQFKTLVQLNPARSDFRRWLYDVYHLRGNVLSSLERREEAVEALKAAIRLRPEPRNQVTGKLGLPLDYALLAQLLAHLERWQEAREAIEAAIRYGRMMFDAGGGNGKELGEDLEKLAHICRQFGDEEAAKAAELDRQELVNRRITKLTRVIEEAPTFQAHFERATLFNETNQPEKAVEDYAKCLEFDPNAYWVYRYRAQTLVPLFRYEEALEDVEKAFKIAHTDDEVVEAMFHRRGEARPADDINLYRMRGFILTWLGRDREAMADFHTVLTLDGDENSSTRLVKRFWGFLLTFGSPDVRDPERALELAKQMLEVQRDDESLEAAGCAYYRLGRYEEARDMLQAASDCAQDPDEWTWIVLAMTKAQLGEEQEAHSLFWNAVKLFDDKASKVIGGNGPCTRRTIHEAASLLDIDLSETMWAEAATHDPAEQNSSKRE